MDSCWSDMRLDPCAHHHHLAALFWGWWTAPWAGAFAWFHASELAYRNAEEWTAYWEVR